MIDLYVRKSNKVEIIEVDNPWQVKSETLEGAVTFGNSWASSESVIFGDTVYSSTYNGIAIKYGVFVPGVTYTVSFDINIRDSRGGIVQFREYNNSGQWGFHANCSGAGAFDFTFTATGENVGFYCTRDSVAIYNIYITANDPNITPVTITAVDSFTQLDLHQDSSIVFQKLLKDVRNPEKMSGEYTKPFKLPITKRNQSFFKGLNHHDAHSSFNVGEKLEAVLQVDGVNHLEGFLQLKSIIEDDGVEFFNVIFYSDLSLFQKLSDVLLTKLDTTDAPINYSAEKIHEFGTNDSIIDGRTAYLHGWNHIFGLMERGERHKFHNGNRPLTQNLYDYSIDPNNRRYGMIEDSFTPSLINSYLFRKIHEEQGYEVAGDILDEIEFMNLVVPLNRAIPQHSGKEIGDHIMNITAQKSYTRTIRADETLTEGNDCLVFRFAVAEDDIHILASDGGTRFIPPNPVRANTKLKLKVLCDAQIGSGNNSPDGFSRKIRFSLHPYQTYGEFGQHKKDLGMYFDDGDVNFLDTQVLGQHTDIYNPGEDNEFEYEFNIGKMLYYSKEYFGDDYTKYPYFELKMYYNEPTINPSASVYQSCLTIAENERQNAYHDACVNFLDSATSTGAPAGTSCYDCCLNHSGQDDLKQIYGYTDVCVQKVYLQTHDYCDDDCADTALATYNTAIALANSTYNTATQTCFDNSGLEASDVMIYNFTFDYELTTEPETTDILLPFGKVIENPILHVSGEITQMDYIKNLVSMFNLYATIDNVNKVVTYNKWEDFYSDEIIDLTENIILEKKIERIFVNDLVPRFIEKEFELIDFDTNTKDYLETYEENPTRFTQDSGNEYSKSKVKSSVKSKFIFDEDIQFWNNSTLYRIASIDNDNTPNKRIDDWGFTMMFFRKFYGNGSTGYYSTMKLNSYKLDNSVYELYFDDLCLLQNEITIYSYPGEYDEITLINSFAVPEVLYTTIIPYYMHTWISKYWKDFYSITSVQESYLMKAYFYLTAEDYFNMKMNIRVKIDNEIYYINKITDWAPNKKTKVELIKFIKNDTGSFVNIPPVINNSWNTKTSKGGSLSGEKSGSNVSLTLSNNSKNSNDLNILRGKGNNISNSDDVVLSGSKNTITSSNDIFVSGNDNSIEKSSNIILKNSNNVSIINSENLTIENEENISYINNAKVSELGIINKSRINSGGLNTNQELFTDAGLIDNGEDMIYDAYWKQSYKLEDGGENNKQ